MNEEPFYLVIPAAGLGKRMRVVNPDIPKEMLLIGVKPAIQYAVEEGLSANIKNIIIVINRQKEMIRQYFKDKRFRKDNFPLATRGMDEIDRQCSVTFLYQDEPLGESDAIYLTKDAIDNHSLAILYPDNIYFPSPGTLITLKTVFEKFKKDVAALMEVNEANAKGIGNSGKVDLEPIEETVFRVKRFYPKGKGSFVPSFRGELRTCGMMISGFHIFDAIEKARESVNQNEEFTDVPVRNLMLKERSLLGCHLQGTVFDIGNPDGYEFCLSFIRNL